MKISFVTLGVLIILLKIFGAISWSWWIVLFPIYAPIVLIGILCLILSLIAFFAD